MRTALTIAAWSYTHDLIVNSGLEVSHFTVFLTLVCTAVAIAEDYKNLINNTKE